MRVDELSVISRPGRSATRSSRSSCSSFLLARGCSLQADGRQPQSGHHFPAVLISISQPGAAPTEIETQITQRVEAAVRCGQRRRRDQFDDPRGQQHDLRPVRDRHADRPRGHRRARTRSPRSAATCPTASSSRRCSAIDIDDEPIGYFAVGTHDMTLEQLSWFVDNTVSNRLLSASRAWPRSAATGGVEPRDPGRCSIRRACRPRASPPARSTSSCAPININAAGGRAEIAGSEQSVRVLGNAAHRPCRSARPRFRLGGGRTVRLDDDRQCPRPVGRADLATRIQNGRQVRQLHASRSAKG